MKNWISALLYIIVITIYSSVQDHELLFMLSAWYVGYFKEMYCESYWTVN